MKSLDADVGHTSRLETRGRTKAEASVATSASSLKIQTGFTKMFDEARKSPVYWMEGISLEVEEMLFRNLKHIKGCRKRGDNVKARHLYAFRLQLLKLNRFIINEQTRSLNNPSPK